MGGSTPSREEKKHGISSQTPRAAGQKRQDTTHFCSTGQKARYEFLDVCDWDGLDYRPDRKTEDYEFAGDVIADAFANSTEDPVGIVVHPYPGRQGMEKAGACIYGGIDPGSGRLVGFMVPNVLT